MDYLNMFEKCEKSLEKKRGLYFAKGNRNNFVFRLACICNRYGMPEREFLRIASIKYQESSYTIAEIRASTQSAYQKNKNEHSKYIWK